MISWRKRKECLLALEVEVSSDTLWPHQALKLCPPYYAKMCKSAEPKMEKISIFFSWLCSR